MVNAEPTVADIGEFGLIARLRQRFRGVGSGVVRGIGDDTAALHVTPGHLLLATTDAALEGTHFLRATISPDALGRRVLAVNLSDIAAMAGTPRWALVSLGLPATTPISFVEALADGLAEEARLYDTEIVGGNIARSIDRLNVDITVLGEVRPDQVLYRTGARPGDRLLVTGQLGDSSAGLAVLSGRVPRNVPGEDYLVSRHRLPTPRVSVGRAVGQSGWATAMIDLSDGLAGDVTHLAEESRVGAVVYADRLPLSLPLRSLADAAGVDPLEWALRGGEDYELLLSAPAENVSALAALVNQRGVALTDVGQLTAGPELWVELSNGRREPLGTVSWQHFS